MNGSYSSSSRRVLVSAGLLGARPAGLGLALVGLLVATVARGEAPSPARVVTLGGAVTEIAFALGAKDRVVGTDTSSSFPDDVKALPKVGSHRAVSVEGVLSLKPDLVLASDHAGPPEAIEQLRAAGARVVVVPHGYEIADVLGAVRIVADALGTSEAQRALVERIQARVAASQTRLPKAKAKPRVVFVYAAGNGALHVSGTGTAADAIVRLAGGENAVGSYEGYRPLSAEGLIAARPDVILFPARSLRAVGGLEGLLAAPGMKLTPAARTGRVHAVDDLLVLGFGPRVGEAIESLTSLLHPSTGGGK